MGFFEDGVFGLAAEVDVGDPVSDWVAGDAVPAMAAVGSSPGAEYTQIRVVKASFYGE